MNIAFVISTKIWGGVKTWMVEFGRELQKRGNSVYFFSNDDVLTEEVRSNGCTAHRLRFGPDYSPISTRFFYKKFKQYDIDIACMNIQKELRTGGIAAKLLKIPVVQRLGLPGDINFKLDQRFAQRFLVDELLVTSQWMKREVAKRFHFIAEEKITCIYNTKAVVMPPRDGKGSPVRFVITSRLAKGKGHKSLVDAFKMLVDQGYREFTCDVFGNGPLESEIGNRIAEAGLQDKITLKGFSRNLSQELRAYDFGILTSFEEGLANVITEYMSFSLPCISSDGGALIELIEHGQNGLLFKYKDSKTLAEHLKTCLEMDDTTYANYSFQACDTVRKKFNLETNVQALENYFLSCIEKYA
ncbi:MAG: glycosyltransferase [Proteobacteria bacterium]|nr:glycosyltransferase [Pseudomonadota bacterium]